MKFSPIGFIPITAGLLLTAWMFAMDYAGDGVMGLNGFVYRINGTYDEVGELKAGDTVWIDWGYDIYHGKVTENDRDAEIIAVAFGPWGTHNPKRLQYDEFCIRRDGK